MPEKQKVESEKKLLDAYNRYPSESKFLMYRNLSYGAAGIHLLIIILLAQIWSESQALRVSLYSSALGMPIWLGLGGIYESYILLGRKSYSHFNSELGQSFYSFCYTIAGISLIISLCSIIYFLDHNALWYFGLGAAIMLFIVGSFHNSLAKTLFETEVEN